MLLVFSPQYIPSLTRQVDPARPRLVSGEFDEGAVQREEDRHPEW